MKNRRTCGCWRQRIAAAFLLGMAVCRASAAEPEAVFRFGTAEAGARLTNQFLLRNGGAEPLAVLSATPSCDCLQIVQWPAQVAAGETGAVDVLFVPDKAGEVDYRVYLRTAAPARPEIEFAVQGTVVAAAPPARPERDRSLYLGTGDIERLLEEPGRATWVDVRGAEAHGRVRIPGSLQIPLYAVKTKGFLQSRPVVLVDEGFGSPALEEECRKLRGLGFADLSLWPGGLNAWRQLGGPLEGDGSAVDRLPPVALHDVAAAADWLVVDAGGGATDRFAGCVAMPFDPAKTDAFISALNAALAARPQAASVLIATDAGADYGAIGNVAGKIDAFVFYLDGGWQAWDAHRQMLDAAQHSRTVVAQGAGTGNARPRSGGCGGCPK